MMNASITAKHVSGVEIIGNSPGSTVNSPSSTVESRLWLAGLMVVEGNATQRSAVDSTLFLVWRHWTNNSWFMTTVQTRPKHNKNVIYLFIIILLSRFSQWSFRRFPHVPDRQQSLKVLLGNEALKLQTRGALTLFSYFYTHHVPWLPLVELFLFISWLAMTWINKSCDWIVSPTQTDQWSIHTNRQRPITSGYQSPSGY